jgi:hypothetical protein
MPFRLVIPSAWIALMMGASFLALSSARCELWPPGVARSVGNPCDFWTA